MEESVLGGRRRPIINREPLTVNHLTCKLTSKTGVHVMLSLMPYALPNGMSMSV